jgi:hypothetical protein
MDKTIEIEMQNEIITAYEGVCSKADDLIKLQKKRITELEIEIIDKNKMIEQLIVLLEETLEIAKTQANDLPTLSAN